MSDSQSDIHIEVKGDAIYGIESANITSYWLKLSGGHEEWEAVLVFIDEDGEQVSAQYWKGGNCKRSDWGPLWIKDNQIASDVDWYPDDFIEDGWEELAHRHIRALNLN